MLHEVLDGLIILSADQNQLPVATVKTLSMTDSQVFTQIEQALLAFFGARVYKGGVLIYGKSSYFKDLKRALMMAKDK